VTDQSGRFLDDQKVGVLMDDVEHGGTLTADKHGCTWIINAKAKSARRRFLSAFVAFGGG
jgi:hypothetical protein